ESIRDDIMKMPVHRGAMKDSWLPQHQRKPCRSGFSREAIFQALKYVLTSLPCREQAPSHEGFWLKKCDDFERLVRIFCVKLP
ncbi:hypothetical protein K5D37_23620, partial [Pseudomonas cichorii]|nr:hypothetical protein [Pseudomonas cichorii]